MEENSYQQIIQLLEGTLPASEKRKLKQWRKAHPDNEQHFQEVKFLWQQTPLAKQQRPPLQINSKIALKKVQQQLPTTAKAVPIRRRFFQWSVAATILFLISFFAWITFSKPIDMMQVATVANETKQVTLPDQSIVFLNENSSIKYPRHFNPKIRRVEMDGDIVFDITHRPQQPFKVSSPNLAVKVLGTKFNVIDKKTTNSTSWVYVLDGKVQVQQQQDTINKVLLEKEMAAVFNPQKNQLLLSKSFAVNQLFWHHQTLQFEQTTLQQVIQTLNKVYQTEIILLNTTLLNCPFTGIFQAKTLSEILETLQLIYGFDIQNIQSLSPQLNQGTCQ